MESGFLLRRRAGAWSARKQLPHKATARRAHIAWKVHIGDILLWAGVGFLFVAGALALIAV